MPNKADTVSRLRSGKQSIVFLSSAFEIHRFKHFLISKMTAKTQSCSWRFCLLATLLLGFIEYQIQKNIYDQSKITLCLAILVRVTCDTIEFRQNFKFATRRPLAPRGVKWLRSPFLRSQRVILFLLHFYLPPLC